MAVYQHGPLSGHHRQVHLSLKICLYLRSIYSSLPPPPPPPPPPTSVYKVKPLLFEQLIKHPQSVSEVNVSVVVLKGFSYSYTVKLSPIFIIV